MRQTVEHAVGSRHHPMSDTALDDKFMDCAGTVLGGAGANQLRQRVWNLEGERSIRSLASLLC